MRRSRKALFATAEGLPKATIRGESYRLIGAGLSELDDVTAGADDRFVGSEVKILRAEQTLDALMARFGPKVVIGARDLK